MRIVEPSVKILTPINGDEILKRIVIHIINISLRQGNCLELIQEIPDKSIDLIATDPPYLISKKSNFNKGGAWNDADDIRCRKTPPKTDFGEWDKKQLNLSTLFKEFYRVLKPSGSVICFYDIWKITELKYYIEQNKFKQLRLCRYDKSNPVPVNSKLNYLTNSSEYFITCVKDKKPTFHSEYDKGIYTYPICSGKERTPHPTQKPLILMDELIKKHSNPNDSILDPFMGSGTTGVACVNTNRNFIGMELDENYFNIAKNRIETAIQTNNISIKGDAAVNPALNVKTFPIPTTYIGGVI